MEKEHQTHTTEQLKELEAYHKTLKDKVPEGKTCHFNHDNTKECENSPQIKNDIQGTTIGNSAKNKRLLKNKLLVIKNKFLSDSRKLKVYVNNKWAYFELILKPTFVYGCFCTNGNSCQSQMTSYTPSQWKVFDATCKAKYKIKLTIPSLALRVLSYNIGKIIKFEYDFPANAYFMALIRQDPS